ncbi:ABC transporter permease [Clostridium oryzae]|uniref:ABC-2 family transporter protein n=1 Tax=Clostridium oryzae TaxID=1450648 RepID=A0A1V4I6W5_9CLOT|nr:ABC transporter permease [Clostridium oryzae]OPJ55721.1 ABC-2 family transporter protein [Clostridium oryzae]
MKAGAIIKNTLKAHLAEWKELVLIYAVFPLVLIMVISFFYKSVYNPDTKIRRININFTDYDNTKTSSQFINMFRENNMKDIFSIKEKGDYEIIIPKNYEKNITLLKPSTIKIIENKETSRSNEAIIKSIISEYGKKITELATISDKVNKLNVVDKEKIYKKITQRVSKNNADNSIDKHILKGQKHLSSYEEQGTSTISFMVMLMIMGCAASYYKDKESGYYKRVMSAPISKLQYFIINSGIFFISSFICGALYITTILVFKIAFTIDNLPNLLIILISQSLLVSSVASLFVAFFSKNVSNFVMVLLMYYQIIFGNTFIPVKILSNKMFVLMTKFSPGSIISNTYRSCLISNSFFSVINYSAIVLTISVIVYAVSIIKVKIRWGEQL